MKSLLMALLFCVPWLSTDHQQKPRDYRVLTPVIRVEPQLWDQVPWQQIGPGQRRKVLHNDRITMMWLELDPAPLQPQVLTHYHPHDQITILVEGQARVRLGEEERVVGPGAAYVAPSNVHHGLQPLSSRVVVVECFTPTREDFRGSPDQPQPIPVTANQVKALVYEWFARLERHQSTQDQLDPQGCTIPAGLQPGQPERVEVQSDGERFQVDIQGQNLRQHWVVRDHGGWPVIQSITNL